MKKKQDMLKSTASQTWNLAKKNSREWIKPFALDVLFFFGLGFLLGGFGGKLVEFLQVMGTELIKQSQELQIINSRARVSSSAFLQTGHTILR